MSLPVCSVFLMYRRSFRWTTHTLTHTPLTALFLGLPRWAGTRKVKPIWILVKQETVSGSGVSLAIWKYAPCSRQITTPTPHHSVFYRPDALPVAQPTASRHWRDYTEPKLVCGIVIRFRWSWQGFCWGTTQHHQLNSYDYHGHDSNIRQPVCNVQTSSKLLVHLIETQCVRSHYLLDTGIMV